MKKIILLVVVLCLTFPYILGQDIPSILENQKIVPISPNAASLGVYGAIPMGHYNGTANIAIPLFEIDLDGKKFPIYLSYQSSGIKVAQEASIVGLGWTLNLGGCITREVRGWDDFNDNQIDPIGYYYNKLPQDNYNSIDLTNWDKDWSKYLDFSNNKLDPEPDIFHFNFASFSGKMFFGKINENGNTQTNATPVVVKEDKYLKIEFNPQSKTWNIWDQDGFQYVFKSIETTQSYTANSSSYNPSSYVRSFLHANPRVWQPNVISSWLLDEIISPLNNKISFKYINENIVTPISIHEDVSYRVETSRGVNSDNAFLCDHFLPEYKYYTYSYSGIEQKRLLSVNFPGGDVSMKYSERLDIEAMEGESNPRKLDQIILSNKNNDLIKLVGLSHKYIYSIGNNKGSESCRLFLEDLSINDQLYSFTYNTGRLPEKNSHKVDYWGYATPGLKTTTPNKKDFELSPSLVFNNISYGGLDRRASEEHTKYGILESITYPTKGKTIFEYELNTFNDDRIPGQVLPDQTETVRNDLASLAYSYMQGPYQSAYSKEFTIPEKGKKVTFKINANHNKRYETAGNKGMSYDLYFHIEKKTGFSSFQTEYTHYDHLPNAGGTEIEVEKSIELPAGTYRIYFPYEKLLEKEYPLLVNTVVYDGYNTIIIGGGGPQEAAINRGCGLRIKKIIDYSDNNTFVEKHYNYGSSGVLMIPPVFHTYFRLAGVPSEIYVTPNEITRHPGLPATDDSGYSYTGTYLRGTSSTYIPFGDGQSVGYSQVEERIIGNNAGTTIYSFHNRRNSLTYDPLGGKYNPGCPSMPDLNNGAPLSIKYIDDKGVLKMKKTFKYDKIQANTLKGLNMYIAPMANNSYHSSASFRYMSSKILYGTQYYDIKPQKWFLENSTDSTYYDNNISNVQSIDFGYHPVILTQNYQKKAINGDIYEQHLKFPIDFTDKVSQGMVSKKMSGILTEAINSKNGKVISAQKVLYQDTLNSYLPKTIQKINIENPVTIDLYKKYYDDDFHYNLYNKNGRILQSTTKNKTPTTYLWSYSGQYPIAQIVNATYEDLTRVIEGGGSYLDVLGNQVILNETDLNKINSLRNLLPYAQITTYTYSPLVGMTSETNPAGLTTYYKYDTFGRLTSVSNNDKELLSEYLYYYSNARYDQLAPTRHEINLIEKETEYRLGLADFSIEIKGGSGNFSYSWSILTIDEGTVINQGLGSNGEMQVNFPNVGDMLLRFDVTDLETNFVQTIRKKVTVLPSIPIAEVKFTPISSPVSTGDIIIAKVEKITGGSGNFTYNWKLIELLTETVIFEKEESSGGCNISPAKQGKFRLECRIKDVMTEEIVTKIVANSIIITSYSKLTAEFSYLKPTYKVRETETVKVITTGGSGNFSYTWVIMEVPYGASESTSTVGEKTITFTTHIGVVRIICIIMDLETQERIQISKDVNAVK